MMHRVSGPPGQAPLGELARRAIAAAILVPGALALIWAGPVPFAFLCLLGALIVHQEWLGLTGARPALWPALAGGAALTAAGALLFAGHPAWAVLSLAAGGVGVACIARLTQYPSREGCVPALLWRFGGPLYAGAPLLALILLRLDDAYGLAVILWLMLVVWATDTCAYFSGRGIGGPRIWPAVSPKKTWAGLIGGMAGAALAAMAVSHVAGEAAYGPMAILGAVTAIVAQAGDFAESAVKRHFGVKDAGGLIPGHGGLMDRVDGLIPASVFILLFGMARAGFDAPGRGILVW